MPFDGTKLDETTQRLIAGREKIEHKWCKRALFENGAVCMIGALLPEYGKCVHDTASWAALERIRGVIGYNVTGWNNAPEREKHEVLEVFDRAIARY